MPAHDAVVAAKSDYLLKQAAVDRATSALERAQARLAEARSQLESARIVLIAGQGALRRPPGAVLPGGHRRGGEHPQPGRSRELQAVHGTAGGASSPTSSSSTRSAAGRSRRCERPRPGYGAYRGGARLTDPGAGGQSINNAVMWRHRRLQGGCPGPDPGGRRRPRLPPPEEVPVGPVRHLGHAAQPRRRPGHLGDLDAHADQPGEVPEAVGQPGADPGPAVRARDGQAGRPRRPARPAGSRAARRRHELPPQPGVLDGGGEDARRPATPTPRTAA